MSADKREKFQRMIGPFKSFSLTFWICGTLFFLSSQVTYLVITLKGKFEPKLFIPSVTLPASTALHLTKSFPRPLSIYGRGANPPTNHAPVDVPEGYRLLLSRLAEQHLVLTGSRLEQQGQISCGDSGVVKFISWDEIAFSLQDLPVEWPSVEPPLVALALAVEKSKCHAENGPLCKEPLRPVPLKRSKPRCAVVGNSGRLKDARFGKQIDSADLVIRFNWGITKGFERQVGQRSNIRIYNGPYVEAKQPGEIVLAQIRDPAVREWARKRQKHNSTYAYVFDPEFICHAWHWVGQAGEKPSTGLVGVVFALSICSSVDVYGFHYEDYFDHSAQPHYYDWERPKVGRELVHPFHAEFELYKVLEEVGRIHFHKA